MRICYVCSDLGISVAGQKGASTYIRSLIKEWTALGHEVFFVAPSINAESDIGVPIIPIPIPDFFSELVSIQKSRIEVKSTKADWQKLRLFRALGHICNNVAVENTLKEALNRLQPDFIYERYSPFSIAGGLIARKAGVPYVLQFNAPLAWEGTAYRKQALSEAAETIEQTTCELAPLIIATCRELKDILIQSGLPEAKIKVVPCGADSELFSPDGAVAPLPVENKFVIGFVGSLKLWHGLDVLSEAFEKLAENPRYHLLVVGDGPMMENLKTLANRLQGRITLTGAVAHEEVPAYMRAMDVSVVPYPDLEKFYFSPLKMHESMAAGRAVVASGIGQIQEIIQDGVTGCLVPPGDAGALVKAVHKLAANDELRQVLGANASREIRQKHTWRHRAEMILDFAAQSGVIAPRAAVGETR